MIRAVVFDMDGALTRSRVGPDDLKERVLRTLARLGLPPSFFSKGEELTEILEKAEAYIRASGLGEEDRRRFWDEITKVLEDFEGDYVQYASAVPGAVEVLASLREKGLKIGLVSFSGSVVVMNLLGRLGIRGFLDALVARDFVDDPKPNSAHLLKAVEELGVEPHEAILISTSPSLVRYAKEIGMYALGLAGGCGGERLVKAGADAVVGSLSEALKVISDLLGER